MAVSKVILNGETLIDVTQKTVAPSNMLSGITALKNDGTDITGNIAAKSAADLITSGSQVTVPSGMYAAAATTAVEAGWISLALGSIEISIDSGRFNIDDQTGIIYINDGVTLTQVPSFIPGYISDVGHLELDVEATGSYQLPVKTAATIVPSTADQVVASGYFLTGAQTVKGDSALIPSNIAAGVSIFGIEGTHQGGGNYQAKTVSPTGEIQIILPDNAYDALSSVTVNAAALQSKVVTPAATSQIISADSSYYGLSQVIVEPIATTSYYLAQDSQGYITYSSIMPSGGEYYIFDVAGIKHVEGN